MKKKKHLTAKQKQDHDALRLKRRIFAVRFGVYIGLIVGVVGSQAIVMSGNLSMALQPIELGQVGGAAFIAWILYNKLENKKGDMVGKTANVSRILRNAVQHGFFWNTIIGAWW